MVKERNPFLTEQITNKLHLKTLKCMNYNDGEINASDTENQENSAQYNPFSPSETSEHRTPIQPIPSKNLVIDNVEIKNEDRTIKDYHTRYFCYVHPHVDIKLEHSIMHHFFVCKVLHKLLGWFVVRLSSEVIVI